MHKQAQTLLMAFTALVLGLTDLPASAQGRFATAPAPVIRSALMDVDLDRIPQGRLSGLLRNIARSIGECQSLRRAVDGALSSARTPDDVHEDWILLHEQCLLQGEEDISEITQAADNIRQEEGDSRPLERIRTDLEALDGVLQDAFAAHDDLIAAYDRTQEFTDE